MTGRRLLFLHIPKTAGTSLLLTLRNLFGDNRVLRADVEGASGRLEEMIADIVATRLPTISCLAGHIPMYAMAPHLEQFRPFTVLRDPVDRVLSLYRFLRRMPEQTLSAIGLRPEFDFDEFISSRHHGVFEQVTNGMCRMLTDDIRLSDPNSDVFWKIDPEAGHGERALAMLERLDFGLVEEMGRTNRLLADCWGLPDTLEEYSENATAREEPEPSPAQLQLILHRNMLDCALYQRAAALFRTRAATEGGATAIGKWATFHPVLDVPAPVGDIPGRRGFHETEGNGFAWLRADRAAQIRFVAPARVAQIRLQLYCITDDYPIDRIELWLNGSRVSRRARWLSPRWCGLELGPLELRPEVNELAILPPIFFSVRKFQPDSRDPRHLSVALSSVTVGE